MAKARDLPDPYGGQDAFCTVTRESSRGYPKKKRKRKCRLMIIRKDRLLINNKMLPHMLTLLCPSPARPLACITNCAGEAITYAKILHCHPN